MVGRNDMSDRTLSRAILILGAVQLIESLAVALPISFFPNYVIGLGASVASVGLFTSSFMIAFAILSPKMGVLVDQYGRKKIMMVGIFSISEANAEQYLQYGSKFDEWVYVGNANSMVVESNSNPNVVNASINTVHDDLAPPSHQNAPGSP